MPGDDNGAGALRRVNLPRPAAPSSCLFDGWGNSSSEQGGEPGPEGETRPQDQQIR
jgi:hypothetical protein